MLSVLGQQIMIYTVLHIRNQPSLNPVIALEIGPRWALDDCRVPQHGPGTEGLSLCIMTMILQRHLHVPLRVCMASSRRRDENGGVMRVNQPQVT